MITVLSAGNPQRKKLDAIQATIAELTAERRAVASANLPPDEVRAACERAVHALTETPAGASIRARLGHLVRPGRPEPLIDRDDGGCDVAALAVALIGEDVIAERLFERVSTHESNSPGLPAAERAKRVAELDKELHEHAIAEEAEARQIESQGGVFVMRRPIAGLDFDAVLEAWDQVA